MKLMCRSGVIFCPAGAALAEVFHPRIDHGRILLGDHLFLNEHRCSYSYGYGDGITWPRIDMKFLVVVEKIERGVKGIVDEIADDYAGYLDLKPVEDVDDQVMGVGSFELDVTHGHGDGIAFRSPDPNGQ